MRARSAFVLATSLLLTSGLSGCISGAFYAAVPTQLATGWTLDASNSETGERGLPPLIVAKYAVNAYTGGAPPGQLYVIAVSDVPLIDEQGEIQKELDARVAEKGVKLTERQRGSGSVGSDGAEFVWFDAVVPVVGRAYAVDARYACKGNGESVRVFGLAGTQGGGILGGGTDLSTWSALVGSAFPGQLGGMVASVRCS
jgi:hypothetical protein